MEGSQPPKAGQANPSTKRKPSEKVDRPPKKPKVGLGPTVGETPAISKLPPKPGPSIGKGLMKSQVPAIEECPILLREDTSYALKQLSSIIKDDDYSYLGNHVTKATGETGLFSLNDELVGFSIDWRYPGHMPLLLKGSSHWTGTPEVRTHC